MPTKRRRSKARLSAHSALFLDLKVAARTAVRARFVSALAVLAFALGIGVTTAVFSIFNGVGAGQGDLARQLTAESVLLALTGGAVGVVLAQWILRTFLMLAGNQLPRAASIAIDGRVLAFTAVVSLAVGICCGLWPLVLLRTHELAAAVREGDSRTGSGAGRRFSNGLVVGEIALAFALLVGASLLVKNLMLLQRRDAGIRTERIVAFDVAPSGPRYKDRTQASRSIASCRRALRRSEPSRASA